MTDGDATIATYTARQSNVPDSMVPVTGAVAGERCRWLSRFCIVISCLLVATGKCPHAGVHFPHWCADRLGKYGHSSRKNRYL